MKNIFMVLLITFPLLAISDGESNNRPMKKNKQKNELETGEQLIIVKERSKAFERRVKEIKSRHGRRR